MAEKIMVKSDSFYKTYDRNPSPNKDVTHYCPGCGHGVLHKLIAEAIDDFGIRERTLFCSPVGCSVFAYYYFRTGNIQCAHGRAPAAATGVKRTHPECIVISYQGDGDLAAIGTAEIIQAANRGENITVFFVNNAIYGMTGGQLAPTTLVGQKTTTSPYGRNPGNEGFPIKVAEMISTLEAPVYVERVAITDAKNTARVRRAVRKGLQNQIDNKGFSLIEVLSICPSGWKMTPVQAKQWMSDYMVKQYPLGVYRDRTEETPAREVQRHVFHVDGIRKALELPVTHDTVIKVAPPAAEYQDPRIKLAGFGGQGVLMLGLMLAEAGMHAGYHVSWIPSYGPEMRGGTANCHVNLSHRRIGSPIVSRPTLLVAMNQPSLEKFESEVVPGGLIIYDTAMVSQPPKRSDVKAIGIPASTIADELGNTRGANMVILGAYIGITAILPKEAIFAAMPALIKRQNLIPLNKLAVEKGMEFISTMRG
jgi:2-oxoisovalerate ferredoxin oxidoreductase beta subunit